MADALGSEMGGPLEVRGGTVVGPSAPPAGSPHEAVDELVPTTVFALPGMTGAEQGGGS